MFVVRIEGGRAVIIGTTKLREPGGSRPQVQEGGVTWELNYVTEDAIREWREKNVPDPQSHQFERSQRAIFLTAGQEPKRLLGFRACKR